MCTLRDAKNTIMLDPSHPSIRSQNLSFLVVDSYEHLGARISFKGMCDEVAFRGGLMRAESAKLRTILRNSSLFFYKKVHAIQAFLLSKGTVQCSTWTCLKRL